MSISLKDKKVLITGSTDGLGKQIALELSKQGAFVIIHGRNQDKVQKTLSELSNPGDFIVCDLNKPETVTESLSKIEKLDILINNAGVWEEGATADASPEKIIEITHVNIASYLLSVRNFIPILKKSEFGQILNVVSVAGYEVPSDYFHTIYSASKYALQGFSEALEKEFHNTNIRVMGFYPGGMNTNIFNKAGNNYQSNEPWMFDAQESVEAIVFMLTRNKKVNVKRMDLINHLEE